MCAFLFASLETGNIIQQVLVAVGQLHVLSIFGAREGSEDTAQGGGTVMEGVSVSLSSTSAHT